MSISGLVVFVSYERDNADDTQNHLHKVPILSFKP